MLSRSDFDNHLKFRNLYVRKTIQDLSQCGKEEIVSVRLAVNDTMCYTTKKRIVVSSNMYISIHMRMVLCKRMKRHLKYALDYSYSMASESILLKETESPV
ncbi:Hypothetical predicted protein [Octopus vulgaris]|uniref:Uncharacterized protein n=1 Tax=Octopus vulgaris TaxID=6645 RepID=A0AA36BND6_OCTVU|nr:Hypothetical predicted protein [Octopus vulgaris]